MFVLTSSYQQLETQRLLAQLVCGVPPAVERGPLVYCIESADHPGERLDDVTVDPSNSPVVSDHIVEPFDGTTALQLTGKIRARREQSWWPYRPVGSGSPELEGESIILTAMPYYLWGNRASGALRVWLQASPNVEPRDRPASQT